MVKNFVLFLFFSIFGLYVNAQKPLRYEGPFNNGLREAGTASYSYILDENRKQIFQGGFRYSVKVKETDYRFTQSFTGNYVAGLKNGQWEYNIATKDYRVPNSDLYETSEIQLTASYRDGIPDGKWKFKAFVQERKNVQNNGQISWLPFKTTKNIEINLNFKNGVLIDTVSINDKLGEYVDYILDENGFVRLLFNHTKNEQTLYVDGVVFEKRVGESNIEKNPDFVVYSMLKNKKVSNVKLDTLSMFTLPNFTVAKILNGTIFNTNYFLFKYITGDKLLHKDNVGDAYKYDFKGFNYCKLSLNLGKNELYYVQKVDRINTEVSEKLKHCKALVKKNPTDENLRKSELTLEMLADKMSALNCWNSKISTSLTTDQGIAAAQKYCGGNLKFTFKDRSHLGVLKAIYDQATLVESEVAKIKL